MKTLTMKTLIIVLILLVAASAMAADVSIAWDTAQGATGYKLQMSTDTGATWSAGVDVGNVLTYTLLGVPDTGLVLFRVLAYNVQDEAITTWAGAWYNNDWKPPGYAGGLGVQ